jgi:hypothetical protein
MQLSFMSTDLEFFLPKNYMLCTQVLYWLRPYSNRGVSVAVGNL